MTSQRVGAGTSRWRNHLCPPSARFVTYQAPPRHKSGAFAIVKEWFTDRRKTVSLLSL